MMCSRVVYERKTVKNSKEKEHRENGLKAYDFIHWRMEKEVRQFPQIHIVTDAIDAATAAATFIVCHFYIPPFIYRSLFYFILLRS